LSSSAPVRTLVRLNQLVGNNTQILFQRGDTFDYTSTLSLRFTNVLVGAYGTGANPVLRYTGSTTATGVGAFTLNGTTSANITIQNLTFDSMYPAVNNIANKIPCVGVLGGGVNIAVRNNTFLNVGGAVTSQNVRGLLLQDNQAPLATGIRGYFLWLEGSDAVVLGNTVANSTREHVLRTGNNAGPTGFQRLLVAHNDFTNLDRSSVDAQDIRKTTLTIMAGDYAWVDDNRLTKGVVCFGPIFGANTSRAQERTKYVVFSHNVISFPDDINSISNSISINPGTEYIRLQSNTVRNGYFRVGQYDTNYARGIKNISFESNLVSTQGTSGRMLYLEDATAQGVTIKNNVFVAPNLVRGAGESGGIWCVASTVSFAQISGNTYSLPAMDWYRTSACHIAVAVSQSTWLSLSSVHGDAFRTIALSASAINLTINGLLIGAS
jgi:hypothetical protein